jgi:hypothetical protein
MNALKAYVENGRSIVDEPTDLPDGTVLHVVPVSDDMDAEERAELAPRPYVGPRYHWHRYRRW